MNHKGLVGFLALIGLVAPAILILSLAPGSSQPAAAQRGSRCFEETGYCIDGRIREYWEQNGGLSVFGYPISEQQEMSIEGESVEAQWFERNRLELHPENNPPYDVLLGRLSVQLLNEQGRAWQAFPSTTTADEGCLFFSETGQQVCGDILATWSASGLELGDPGVSKAESLALFGLPISPLQEEEIDGETYQVQWFERARFELHPENEPPYNVLLGLLGRESKGQESGATVVHEIFYLCDEGLCRARVGSSKVDVIVDTTSLRQGVHSYAVSTDGQTLVYALGEMPAPDLVTVYRETAERPLAERLTALKSKEATNGMGESVGFGVRGVSIDGQDLIYEEEAQVSLMPNGCCEAWPITGKLGYGVSAGPRVFLSPRRTRVMVKMSNDPERVLLYRMPASATDKVEPTSHKLGATATVAEFGRDDDHLLVYRFDTALPPDQNPVAIERSIKGLEEHSLKDGTGRILLDTSISPQTSYPYVLSNSTGRTILVQMAADEVVLLDILTGKLTPVTQPDLSTVKESYFNTHDVWLVRRVVSSLE
jgi:hypothetical protein